MRLIHGELFFDSLIAGYVTSARFVHREWLERRVQDALRDAERPFVLITAEPGAGKSALVASLASRNPRWPRYFIRRDQIAPLGTPGARSFLFQTGLQLAAWYPDIFTHDRIQITIEQRVRNVAKDGRAIGAEVQTLVASPFVSAALRIRQQVEEAAGEVVALRIEKWFVEPRLIPMDDLQCLALVDPATAIAEDHPGEQIVVLIDALDELRYQPQDDSLLDWLSNCPELPANVHLLVTSRPDEELLRRFRARQGARIREFALDYRVAELKPWIDGDLGTYASGIAATPAVDAYLAVADLSRDAFTDLLVRKADGNLGYVNAVARAVDRALLDDDTASLQRTLALSSLPGGLLELYAYFLDSVRDRIGDRSVSVEDPQSGQTRWVSAWSEVYLPILGALTVAAEPLTSEQIRRLAGVQSAEVEVLGALDRLRQFLDETNGAYCFYHSTLPEFLSAAATRDDPRLRPLYQDSAHWHRQFSQSYRRAAGNWTNPNWAAIDDYGWRHLSAHLSATTRRSGFGELFDLYAGGFLEAKRDRTANVAELEDDWRIILDAAREAGDFTAFVRFGYRISRQYSEVAHLQSGPVARTAARLAIRRRDEAALRRIASAATLITHPAARVDITLAVLDELTAGLPDSALIKELLSSVDVLLPALDPGTTRDVSRATFVEIAARRDHPDWKSRADDALSDTAWLPSRMRLRAVLAERAGGSNAGHEAAQLVSRAIDECSAFEIRDDIVPMLLHAVLGADRIDPDEVLGEALAALVKPVAALPDDECEKAITAIRQQAQRLRQPEAQLGIDALLVEACAAAGWRERAARLLTAVVDEQIVQSQEMGLLLLLPAIVAAGNRGCADAAVAQIARSAREGSLVTWLVSAVPLMVQGTARVSGARGAIAEILRRIGDGDGMDAPFIFLGEMACAWACAGDVERARALLERLLREVSPAEFEVPEWPEESQLRAGVFSTTWWAACKVGDRALMDRTLDWLLAAVRQGVYHADASRVWAAAISSLDATADPDVAEHALGRLRVQFIESRNALMYHATALLQLADAWEELHASEESLRLVAEALDGLGRLRPITLLTWAASLRGRAGDLEGCESLLDGAISTLPSIEGLNIQEDAVEHIARSLGVLGRSGDRGPRLALPLLQKLLEAARAIDHGEYSLYGACTVVQTAADCGFDIGSTGLAEEAKQYLERLHGAGGFRPVMYATGALGWAAKVPGTSQAVAARGARDLHEQIERRLETAAIASDADRASLCEEYAALANTARQAAFGDPSERLRERCMQERSLITDAVWRVQACAALAHVEAWRNCSEDAARLLEEAVAASVGVEEVYEVKSAADRLFKAWEAIPDIDVKGRLIERLQDVIYRIPDPYDRDVLAARLFVSMWEDPKRYAALLAHVVTPSGMTVILEAVRSANRLPTRLACAVLYHVVGACTRQPRPAFAGEALAATQAAVHHKLFAENVLSETLREIRSIMREIAGQQFQPQGSPT